jgi:putative transposase
MLVAEQFIKSLIRRYGKHNISTDGGTWYPQACRFLNIEHHNHSSIEKSFIERTIQYRKDRTEFLMIIFLVQELTANWST